MSKCPNCGSDAFGSFCASCGSKIPDASGATPASAQQYDTNTTPAPPPIGQPTVAPTQTAQVPVTTPPQQAQPATYSQVPTQANEAAPSHPYNFSQQNAMNVGYQQPAYQQPVAPFIPTEPTPPKQAKGLSLAGLIVSAISILFCWFPVFNFMIAIPGTILSIIGFRKWQPKKALAIASLIVSIVAIVACFFATAAIASGVDSMLEEWEDEGIILYEDPFEDEDPYVWEYDEDYYSDDYVEWEDSSF